MNFISHLEEMTGFIGHSNYVEVSILKIDTGINEVQLKMVGIQDNVKPSSHMYGELKEESNILQNIPSNNVLEMDTILCSFLGIDKHSRFTLTELTFDPVSEGVMLSVEIDNDDLDKLAAELKKDDELCYLVC